MNFDDYCQKKAAPPGSSIYYALRQAPLTSQGALIALFALRRELEEATRETSEPAIGQTKLAWWRKELAALAEGQPSHPVSQALALHASAIASDHAVLQALADGFAMDLEQTRYLDWPNLRRYVERVGGGFAGLVARATTGPAIPADIAPAWAASLGEGLQLAQIVEDVGDDLRHGRVYLPFDELQRYEVTSVDLMHRRYSPAFRKLMRFQVTRARETLHAALEAIPAAELPAQRSLRALAALALATLDEIEGEDYQVLHQRILLTPIRKLWVAWRAAQRRY
ncbi:MAG: squalene/phytoene synthase family protein [Burkholderia sp.]|uniref:All-trans-phytoene synthase n=1 Tax=Burkholderia gladioli TaxID=28095 RepID=A0A2Z4XG65_BURGA|nr:all-trans-phytoene synthase [Burkholderia gladioli]KAF1018240.1 MAG: All-trans-phytoene synthase [Burkholderia gladioli]